MILILDFQRPRAKQRLDLFPRLQAIEPSEDTKEIVYELGGYWPDGHLLQQQIAGEHDAGLLIAIGKQSKENTPILVNQFLFNSTEQMCFSATEISKS